MINRTPKLLALIGLSLLLVLAGCDLTDVFSTFPLTGSQLTSDNQSSNTGNETVRSIPALDQTLIVQTEGQGTVTMDPPGGAYSHDSVVTLTATPDAGWQFKYWKTATGNVEVWFQIALNPAVVIMNEDKTVLAIFEQITTEPTPTPTPTPTPAPLDARLFGTWYGTANVGNMAITVVFNDNGTYSISGPGWRNYGTFSTDQTRQPHWINVLNQWNMTWLGLYEVSDTSLRWGEQQNTRPASLETAPYLYTLTRQRPTPTPPAAFTLTLNTDGNGSLIADPTGPSYPGGTIVQLTATPAAGWHFDHWEGVVGDNGTATITMDADKTVTAFFVGENPIASPTPTPIPVINQVAQPEIKPRYGTVYTFSHSIDYDITCATSGATIYYTLDGSDPSPTNGMLYNSYDYYTHYVLATTTIKARAYLTGMDPSPIGSAVFTQVVQYYLSVYPTGGGSVSVSPSDGVYAPGTLVYLTAVPNPGYQFVEWQGDLTGSVNPASVSMDKDKIISAVFVEDAATPTFNPDGASSASPLTVSIACATPGAIVRYTSDGNDPTTSSPVYTAPVLVDHYLTLKARAWAAGYGPSAVKSAVFAVATNPILSDNNSQVRIDLSYGMLGWMVDGVDHFYKDSSLTGRQWFWYYISNLGQTSLQPVTQMTMDTNANGEPDTMYLKYQSAGQFQIEITYVLRGGGPGTHVSDIAESVQITNLSPSSLDLHFFQYTDMDLNGTAYDDTVTLVNPSILQQEDGGPRFNETIVTPTPDHWEFAPLPVTLDKLNNSSMTALSDSVNPFGPADATWALEWDRSLGIGATLSISEDMNIRWVP